MGGFFGGDQGAGQAVCERAAAADLDPERDGEIDRQARNARRGAKQRVERFKVVAERLSGSSNQAKMPPSP